MKPDFKKYSLALIYNDKIIFSSRESGLKPLWECLEKHCQSKTTYILFDKVIGLAAAKLIVSSKIISGIQTILVSKPAKKFLKDNAVPIKTKETVANILTKNRYSICPGEIIALNTNDPDDFYAKIKAMLSNS